MLPTKLIKKMESALMQKKEPEKVEWVDAEEARKLLSRGKEIKPGTLSKYVSSGKIPPTSYTKSPNGKLWFNKQKLLGL